MREGRGDQRPIRCAIYTRKSTEEGLDQEFNSLDAQREACAAYILSQKHEGWQLLPDFYDDGGYSGGNMERPGLKQLLAEVEAGRVDVIVVYKVDRLTRSLADFAKIVNVLDATKASFVSVTQSFNTTTSMGRLTLNVLLSFAQFEREVTGERIRDKIAASKKKGMWMGGPVPLGYEVVDRRLVVNDAEAASVRHIYNEYLQLGSVPLLIGRLAAQGIRTKVQNRTSGPHRGGIPFARGSLYHLLKNPIYIGQIAHKGTSYSGEHEPIVPPDVWKAVQKRLASNAAETKTGSGAEHPSLLIGILSDGLGRRMSPSHAAKGTKRYRYYITHGAHITGEEQAWRVSAHDVEGIVLNRVASWLDDPAAIDGAVAEQVTDGAMLHNILRAADQLACILRTGDPSEQRAVLLRIAERVQLREDGIAISLSLSSLDQHLSGTMSISVPAARVRRGHDVRLVIAAAEPEPVRQRDERLVALVAEAHAARRGVMESGGSVTATAAKLGKCRNQLMMMMRLSYLAPDIVEAILDGRQPDGLTRRKLMATNLAASWDEQRRQLGFG